MPRTQDPWVASSEVVYRVMSKELPGTSGNSARPPSGRCKLLLWLVMALFSIGLAFGVAEITVRIWKRNVAFQPDPALIRSLKPSRVQATEIWDTDDNLNGRSAEIPSQPERYIWPTNAAGLRMAREVGEKAAGERRVLLLGDSFTEGLNVHPGQRFADLVDVRLSSRPASDGIGWNAINGGIQNSAPSQYILQLRRWLPAFEPDIVVVALAPNDLFDDTTFERSYGFEFDAKGMPLSLRETTALSILRWSYFARYLETALFRFAPAVHGRIFSPATDVPVADWKPLLCSPDPQVEQLWLRKTGHYLQGLRDMSEASGARFAVLMIHYHFIFDDEPWYHLLYPGLEDELRRMGCRDTKGAEYRRFVSGFLEENRIPFRDSYDAFLSAKREDPKRKLWGFYDYHFSPAGHRVMAAELSALLDPLVAEDSGRRAGAPAN